MAYIPENAEWCVAEVVEEITVEGDARNVVHKNLILIHAHSPEEAYERTIEFGKQSETAYQNPDGKGVLIKFRGVHRLDVVDDPLERGAELIYTEEISVPEDKILELLKAEEQLSVFRQVKLKPTTGPTIAARKSSKRFTS
jgi:hypothetical protein